MWISILHIFRIAAVADEIIWCIALFVNYSSSQHCLVLISYQKLLLTISVSILCYQIQKSQHSTSNYVYENSWIDVYRIENESVYLKCGWWCKQRWARMAHASSAGKHYECAYHGRCLDSEEPTYIKACAPCHYLLIPDSQRNRRICCLCAFPILNTWSLTRHSLVLSLGFHWRWHINNQWLNP